MHADWVCFAEKVGICREDVSPTCIETPRTCCVSTRTNPNHDRNAHLKLKITECYSSFKN